MKRQVVSILCGLFLLISCSSSEDKISRTSFKVMSYNIKVDYPNTGTHAWSNRKEDVIRILNEYDAEIIGVQEALFYQKQDMLNGLANYISVGISRDNSETDGEFCSLFIDTTRFEILVDSTFWLSPTPSAPSMGWNAAFPRIVTYARLRDKIDHTEVQVANTHFDHISEEARVESARLITKWYKSEANSPFILMGDLNATPDAIPVQVFNDWMTDAFTKADTGMVNGTFNGFSLDEPTARIDYIFVQDLTIQAFEHIYQFRNDGNQISDHQPIFATLIIE